MTAQEQAAIKAAIEARNAIAQTITLFGAAGYGSHVIDPLRNALDQVNYSMKEAQS